MALVDMNTLVGIAQRSGVMLPAYNTTNMEMTLAIMDAFEANGLPGVVQIAPTNVKLTGYELIADCVRAASESYTVPVALHLDHGKTLEDVRQAVLAGFTSVMIDGAALPFEENIAFSRQAVEFCHVHGVSVEAELGAIAGKEDDHVSEANSRTNPDEVAEFVERTGCDLLAVSIGNVHGLEERPNIDLAHLEKIAKVCPCPLVLHGGSGIDPQIISQMAKHKMVKINIASDLRRAFISAIHDAQEENPNEANLAGVLLRARAAVSEVARKTQLAINGLEDKAAA
ncbi:class II aldolase [Collinsella sp. AGMB00827]|uniref:Class II aldolase n=1 Tax=Collinsella ureilytica TaxID=2869515 RepID=A0ABS7MLY9_9ACTN|nr:class II aldolase [Collinsella urealyticum]MBY4798379.1 class II aldolase [Collinsella urealyticum]